jgi:hypothetical protein
MRNRYGNEYSFQRVDENTYTIVGDLKYWRFGGREGQREMDMTDLGFVDPSGGPFIAVGGKIESRTIHRIRADGDLDGMPVIMFEVE